MVSNSVEKLTHNLENTLRNPTDAKKAKEFRNFLFYFKINLVACCSVKTSNCALWPLATVAVDAKPSKDANLNKDVTYSKVIANSRFRPTG